MEVPGTDLLAQGVARHEAHVGVGTPVERVAGTGQLIVMLGLRGELELARAREVAVDPLLRHDALDRVDGGVEGVVKRHRLVEPEPGFHRREILGEAVVALAAVAARRSGADVVGLQQSDGGAALRQSQRRGQSRETAAHDRNIDAAVDRARRAARKTRRRVVPVGSELHAKARLRARSRPQGRRYRRSRG